MEMLIDKKLKETAEANNEKFIQIYTQLCSS